MKKLVSLVLALVMIMAVAAASAATLTINRDSTWDENAENANVTFTYYKIFDAAITTAGTVNASTGETDRSGNVVYTISGTNAAEKAAALPAIFKADLGADGKYYITLVDNSTTAATIVTALKTMVEGNTTLFPGTSVTSDDNPVVIDGLDPAYYLIVASNGKNLAVQTVGNVTINEKNDYPSIDKKQKKENGTWVDAPLPEEIGKVIEYKIEVKVPADANKPIKVIDTMTAGLTYGDDLAAKVGDATVAYDDLPANDPDRIANATFQIVFSEATVIANRGKTIVLTYTGTVNTNAITDSGKENEVTLKYDEGNYVLKDHTDYETYFGGIYKVDPDDANANMAGVKFVLKDGAGNAVNVTYDDTNGYYVVDPNGSSNEVVTRAETSSDGKTYYTIKIRGFDEDKTYKLTETATVAGYNLLNGDVTLTLTKDAGDAFSTKALDTFDKVENKKGVELPSTGGIGTTIFYILGGLLVVGAAVILVARRRVKE